MILPKMCIPYFNSVRAWLELLYFLSGPALVAGLIFAARQVRSAAAQVKLAATQLAQSKLDMDTRYKREAVLAALVACGTLRDFMTGALDRSQAIFTNPPLEMREWRLLDAKFEWSSLAERDAAIRWLTSLAGNAKKLDVAISVCNQMELFALPFIKRVADEETAYEAAGAVFCNQVTLFAPLFIGLRNHTLIAGGLKPLTSGPFANTIALFMIWNSRAEKEKLAASAKELDDKISRIEIPAIRPFGVGE